MSEEEVPLITADDFKPLSSSTVDMTHQNTLLFGPPGVGKTTQAALLKAKYGKTLILSGEEGLSSIKDDDVEYMKFSRYAAHADPAKELAAMKSYDYSLSNLLKFVAKYGEERGYKVVVLDSLTKASQFIFDEAERFFEYKDDKTGAIYQRHNRDLEKVINDITKLKFCNKLVIALEKKENLDELGKPGQRNTRPYNIPFIMGKKVVPYIMGAFDNVWGFYKAPCTKTPGAMERFFVTQSVNGWEAKTRDPSRPPRLRPIEGGSDITELYDVMKMPKAEFKALEKQRLEETKEQQSKEK